MASALTTEIPRFLDLSIQHDLRKCLDLLIWNIKLQIKKLKFELSLKSVNILAKIFIC